ncbi:ATPase MipZ [Rubripirellula obstinata]|uniref:ATPase MipZ n=1 Tax=Rubripirellula obstinata TaxID=406547 RepID=A0A5B1CMJ4_9BACT|nr:division plane positioning ATPase MipZ [Rubripirellula obstinata]KAA1260554.1 ATPase MipZ [Rubripirellula obstinata]
MSSTGQAFVKSFARRSQTNSTNRSATQTTEKTVSPSRSERLAIADSDAAATNAAEMRSAELWVDSFDDTQHRIDQASGSVSAPHLHSSSVQQNSSSVQQASTANDVSGSQPAGESPEAILSARIAKALQPSQVETQSIPRVADTLVTDTEPAEEIQQSPQRLSEAQTNEPLRASWEVEVFDIPQPVADLFFDESLFQDLSDRMKEASQGGLRTMLMTSALAGEGRTTVAIGVALAAAASGLRVALVDGDLAEPTLAEELRLDLDHSWVESVRRGVPIKEIAVHAVEDNLTLIPLLPTDSGRQATAVECAQMIETLKPSFDLIVVDGPTADARDIRMLGSAIDSVIIVHDVNQSSDSAADLLAARLQRAGIDGVGIVENFA